MLELHVAATWFMVGVIWFVQVVHYPLFSSVGESTFADFHREHTRRISTLLVVPGLTEVATAAGLVWFRPQEVPLALVVVAGALLALIWVVTAAVHVPLHSRLADGRGDDVAALVRSNWIRSALWTGRGALVFWMLVL